MKKGKYIFLGLVIVAIVLFLYLMPRRIVKQGYFYRTYEYIMYVDKLEKNADGTNAIPPDSTAIRIQFDQKYNYLFDDLNKTAVLKVEFEGKYYPVSIEKHLGKVKPKIYVENLIKSEPF